MAKDPYRYFRIEAGELVESLRQDALNLENEPANREKMSRILRLAHTLKGAARVVRQSAIAELAHEIEDALAPVRDSQQVLPRETVAGVLRALDAVAARVAELSAGGAPSASPGSAPSSPSSQASPAAPAAQRAENPLETVRVEISEMDALLEQIAAMRTQIARMKSSLGGLEGVEEFLRAALPRARNRIEASAARTANVLDEALARLNRVRSAASVETEKLEAVAAQARESANQLRLMPVHVIFPSLEYAVHDAATVLQRKADFSASGGDIRLDAHVLAVLRDALLQVVRNAVAHGIEPEQDRVGLGKPPAGRIELKIERRGARVALICSDDGRGIDMELLKRTAVERGHLAANEAAATDAAGLTKLMMQGGLSTARTVTAISGRGVGMDVVRDAAFRLKSEVSIHSDPGRGTCVEFCVPYSLSSLKVLVVRDGPVRAAIPFDCVRRAHRRSAAELLRSADGESVPQESGAIPFMPLSQVLAKPLVRDASHTWTVLEIQSAMGSAALGVEHLSSAEDWVIHPLPKHIQASPIFSGASLDVEGAPVLVLSATETVQAISLRGARAAATAPAETPTVLVIDDSLTTRMLEQSILESAGYRVELATSAEEGLAKARAASYALFLVDVEMPGMDGFQFVESIRADPKLYHLPAILVTSRNAVEDLQRGRSAGANDYIVKSEFDQGRLLGRIRELIGA